LTLIFSGFIRDNPRPSASFAFYLRVLCPIRHLLIPYARLKNDLNHSENTAGGRPHTPLAVIFQNPTIH
jgi:hypothetical protein